MVVQVPYLAYFTSLAMIVTALMISDERKLPRAVKLYGVQSSLLAATFVVLALYTGYHFLILWAASALVTKTVLVPLILLRLISHTRALEEKPLLGSTLTWLLSAGAIAFGFAVGSRFAGMHTVLLVGVSISLFLIGLIQIVSRRSLVKQILGFCHFENGSHLTLAVLAPGLPETVEIGIATDAVLLVFVASLVARLIWRSYKSLDYTRLKLLREEV